MKLQQQMIGLVALAIVTTGCGLPSGEYFGKVASDPDPTHFRWCNSGEPEFIDPALVTSTIGIPVAFNLFDGLTIHNQQGLPEPSLATHWDVSPDQRRFTFYLHDRGRWSDGRAITAHDFAFHIERVLNPLSFSRNAEVLWKLKGAQLYTEGRIKKVMRDAPPFAAGQVVEIIADSDAEIADSNARTAEVPLRLRERGAPVSASYATVPPGTEVTLLDRVEGNSGDGSSQAWARVHWAYGDGVYGWVPAAELTGQPNGAVEYRVKRIAEPHRVGVDIPVAEIPAALNAEQVVGTVRGADLLALPEILGVRVPDDHTLVIETWGPVPYLIDLTVQQAFRATPRQAVSRWPLRWTRPEHIVTSGPFHLRGWYERDRLEMVKSETYWNHDEVHVDRFTAFSMNDRAASTHYYMQGSCDATTSNHIPATYLPALSGERRGGKAYKDYVAAPFLGIYFYLINTETVNNRHLRRALSLSIDRAPLPKLLHGGQIPSAQFVPGTPIAQLSDDDLTLCGVDRDTPGVAMIVRSGELCYVPPPGLNFDLAAAKRELATAKEQMGDAFPKKLSLKFNTGIEMHKTVAEYIQHEWQDKLGLRVELASQEWKTYLKATLSGEYDVGRFGFIGNFPDPESEFLSMFKCNAPTNRTRFCNDEFEELYRQAESSADRAQRLAIMRRAESVVLSEMPVIPLFVYNQVQLQKPYVRDLLLNLSNKQPLHKVWIDPDWDQPETNQR